MLGSYPSTPSTLRTTSCFFAVLISSISLRDCFLIQSGCLGSSISLPMASCGLFSFFILSILSCLRRSALLWTCYFYSSFIPCNMGVFSKLTKLLSRILPPVRACSYSWNFHLISAMTFPVWSTLFTCMGFDLTTFVLFYYVGWILSLLSAYLESGLP